MRVESGGRLGALAQRGGVVFDEVVELKKSGSVVVAAVRVVRGLLGEGFVVFLTVEERQYHLIKINYMQKILLFYF
jgi:hypothetical protein